MDYKKLKSNIYFFLFQFDIDDILSKLKGKPIRELEIELKKDSYLAPKHIKLLVRTLVLHLFCDREG